METLSSSFTFFYKYLVISIWIIGFGAGTADILFFDPQFDTGWMKYAASWIGIAIFIFFATGGVKKVILDKAGKKLIVSNYLKTITIPITQIKDIDGSTFLSPRQVWFVLESASPFGNKICFLPRYRQAGAIGKHPLVIELKKQLKV